MHLKNKHGMLPIKCSSSNKKHFPVLEGCKFCISCASYHVFSNFSFNIQDSSKGAQKNLSRYKYDFFLKQLGADQQPQPYTFPNFDMKVNTRCGQKSF